MTWSSVLIHSTRLLWAAARCWMVDAVLISWSAVLCPRQDPGAGNTDTCIPAPAHCLLGLRSSPEIWKWLVTGECWSARPLPALLPPPALHNHRKPCQMLSVFIVNTAMATTVMGLTRFATKRWRGCRHLVTHTHLPVTDLLLDLELGC